MAKVTIANTLVDISNESKLQAPERIVLRRIAQEVKKLLKENRKLRKLLGEIKKEPLAVMKITRTLKGGN